MSHPFLAGFATSPSARYVELFTPAAPRQVPGEVPAVIGPITQLTGLSQPVRDLVEFTETARTELQNCTRQGNRLSYTAGLYNVDPTTSYLPRIYGAYMGAVVCGNQTLVGKARGYTVNNTTSPAEAELQRRDMVSNLKAAIQQERRTGSKTRTERLQTEYYKLAPSKAKATLGAFTTKLAFMSRRFRVRQPKAA